MLPNAFVERMKTQLGEDFDPFMQAYEDHPDIGLRINTLKLGLNTFSEISPFDLNPIKWTAEGFILPKESNPGKHPYHAAGLYYLQDPSAMAVTELLEPQPGERVLDLAAAPGGKATHIASKMQNQGLFVANDIHPRRVRHLCNNLERWGVRNAVVLNETPARLAAHFGAFFDRVLLDAPCSGEGMFRKDNSAISEWSPKMVESCANRQDAILRDAASLVKPGGRLVYATCTFAPEENEGAILRFLNQQPAFKLESVQHGDGFFPGRPDWVPVDHPVSAGVNKATLSRAVQLWPHRSPGEGHFIAVLTRRLTPQFPPAAGKARATGELPREVRTYFEAFSVRALIWQPPEDRLCLRGSYLYLSPVGLPDLHGLCVIHWGWWLGIVKGKRFEPAHSLVMALKLEEVREVCDFKADDLKTLRYIRGEVLPVSGPDGWVMVAVDGFPLGWAKRVQERLKSRSPRWLRGLGWG